MEMKKFLLELLKDPESEISILLEQLEAEEGVENLESLCVTFSRVFGRDLLERAVQARADKKPLESSPCPACAPKSPPHKGVGFPPSATDAGGM